MTSGNYFHDLEIPVTMTLCLWFEGSMQTDIIQDHVTL